MFIIFGTLHFFEKSKLFGIVLLLSERLPLTLCCWPTVYCPLIFGCLWNSLFCLHLWFSFIRNRILDCKVFSFLNNTFLLYFLWLVLFLISLTYSSLCFSTLCVFLKMPAFHSFLFINSFQQYNFYVLWHDFLCVSSVWYSLSLWDIWSSGIIKFWNNNY